MNQQLAGHSFAAAAQPSPKKVLVVEDSKSVLALLCAQIEHSQDIQTLRASSLAETAKY